MKQYILMALSIVLFTFSTPSFSDQLIIEPDDGRTPILAMMQHANSSIQLVMYGLTDETFINALVAAKNKNLSILLEKSPYKAADENLSAITAFQKNNISLSGSNPAFKLTHQKTFLFDHQHALIMTFNLTHSTFTHERNFALLTDTPSIVHEMETVFNADKERYPTTVHDPNLAWCPNNCREKILTFIESAHHDIKVYAQDITDYAITGALASAARTGSNVQLLLSASSNISKNKKRFAYLTRAGVKIHFNQQYIIHAKVIIIDEQHALLGSINLTEPSLNDNRELSVITSEKNVLRALLKTFQNDWGN